MMKKKSNDIILIQKKSIILIAVILITNLTNLYLKNHKKECIILKTITITTIITIIIYNLVDINNKNFNLYYYSIIKIIKKRYSEIFGFIESERADIHVIVIKKIFLPKNIMVTTM